ncbi:hypothetical protein D9757_001119 [Collybiopsis confluens]|uniref:F-box domain-containing protein n=1 Tax=Collybiopsis confluens TaxID=2823264 RepID=A0A8H5MGJ9_9AGAR|nr:hypothetical protein D9757_001119 [Collybiopsis confluens]
MYSNSRLLIGGLAGCRASPAPPLSSSVRTGSSKINDIPTEILLLIFSQLDLAGTNVLDSSAGTWPLTKVSKRWRSIVINYPSFWSNLTVDFDAVHRSPSSVAERAPKRPLGQGAAVDADVKSLLSTYIQRSQDLPLTVQIRWRNYDSFTVSEELYDGIGTLMSTSRRWTSAALDLTLMLLYETSLVLYDQLPLLRRLKIKLDQSTLTRSSARRVGNDYRILSTFPLDTFQIAPKLKRVELEGVLLPTRVLCLPWKQLTHLYVHPSVNTPMLYDYLEHAVNVEECHMSWFGEWEEDRYAAMPLLHLPQLTKLVLDENAGSVLEFLDAPCLEVLHIKEGERAYSHASRAYRPDHFSPGHFDFPLGSRWGFELIDNVRLFLEQYSVYPLDSFRYLADKPPRTRLPLKELWIESVPFSRYIREVLFLAGNVEKLALKIGVSERRKLGFEDLMKWLKYRNDQGREEGEPEDEYDHQNMDEGYDPAEDIGTRCFLPNLKDFSLLVVRQGVSQLEGEDKERFGFVRDAARNVIESRMRGKRVVFPGPGSYKELAKLERVWVDVRDDTEGTYVVG